LPVAAIALNLVIERSWQCDRICYFTTGDRTFDDEVDVGDRTFGDQVDLGDHTSIEGDSCGTKISF
jgi:hypothetical protein